MKFLFIIGLSLCCLFGSGCTTAQAVPKASFKFNPRTGALEITNPKDTEVSNIVVTIAQTNGMRLVQFQIGTYKTVNNPDVIEKSGAGTAAMIQAGGNVALQSFVQGVSAAQAAGVIPKIPSLPAPK